MRISLLLCFVFFFQVSSSFSQPDPNDKKQDSINVPIQNIIHNEWKTPYTTKFKVDAPIIAGGVGLNLLGYQLIENKKDLTPEQLESKTVDKIPFFDRGNAGKFSREWDNASYPLFHGSFALPVVVMLIDKTQRKNFVQIATLYLETMAIVGGIYTMSAGVFNRSRPWVYGENTPYTVRISATNQRSFMAGHTASVTASMVFAVKIFSDLHPDSKWRPYLWTTAIATSAFMGYMRYKAGAHFLSDNLAGFATGFLVGYFVPQLHKNKKLLSGEKLSIIPYGGPNSGIALLYKF